jgi:CRP-like cAMP-binding protein
MNPDTLRPIARSLLRTYQVRSSRSKDLSAALSKGVLCSWGDGDVMCGEGDPSTDMFIILKGKVRVMRNDVNGVPRELAILESPTMVGQMGLVDGSVRSATCISVEHVGAISITHETFTEILSEATAAGSAFRHLLLSSMSRQLSSANEKIRSLIEDMENEKMRTHQKEMEAWRESMRKRQENNIKPKESSSERLLKIAGVLDGWNLDANLDEVDDVEFFEDEDMRRTREARDRR